MDRTTCQQFFLQPGGREQRRYEVLRAIFVDQDTALDVAERFRLSHGTVRNWVSQFGAQLERGEQPPFSMAGARNGADRTKRMICPKRLTFSSCPWKSDADGGRGGRDSFCSCRCWLGYVSTGLWNGRAIPARRRCLPRALC